MGRLWSAATPINRVFLNANILNKSYLPLASHSSFCIGSFDRIPRERIVLRHTFRLGAICVGIPFSGCHFWATCLPLSW